MSLLSIPNELQSEIFTFLPRVDLFNLTQTSHHLHDVSIRILYRKVELNRWDHLHAFFILSVGRDVREGRRFELEGIRELEIAVGFPSRFCDLLFPIPKHLKTAPLLIPILRVSIHHMHCLSPLLAVLESSNFQIQSDGKTDAWVSQTLSPSSLAEDALRREVRAFVFPVQPFCLSYVVDAFMGTEMDQMVYEILHGERRSRELVAIVVDSLHQWISQLGLATIHSLPNDLLAEIVVYLPKSARCSCVTVNQRIHDVAIPILYSTVLFKTWKQLESFFLPHPTFAAGSELVVQHEEKRRKEWDSIRDLRIDLSSWDTQIPQKGFFPVPPSLKSKPLVVRNLEVKFKYGVRPDPSPLLILLSYIPSDTFFLSTDLYGNTWDVIVAELVASKARKSLARKLWASHVFCATTIMDYLIDSDPEELLLCTTDADLLKKKADEAAVRMHRDIESEGLATFSSLPPDLKSQILAYSPISVLVAVSSLSRTFRSVALPFLYDVVTLRSWKRVESFFFHPPSPRAATPKAVATRIENRRSELRLVRHLVLDFQTGCSRAGSLLRLSPSSDLTSDPLLLPRLTIIHSDLIDPLLPILNWVNPSSVAIQSLGGNYSSEGDSTWRTLVPSNWNRVTHVEFGVHHTQPIAPIRSKTLLASSPFRTASSGVLTLVGGGKPRVDEEVSVVVELFDSICPALKKVKVKVSAAKVRMRGVKKDVEEMLERKGWGEKWEQLAVVTMSSLKSGKAVKVSK